MEVRRPCEGQIGADKMTLCRMRQCKVVTRLARFGHYRGLDFQISRQPLRATLSAEPAFFVATKWTRWIEFVVSVRPDHACAQLVDRLENLAAFVSPYARA